MSKEKTEFDAPIKVTTKAKTDLKEHCKKNRLIMGGIVTDLITDYLRESKKKQ